MNVISFSHFFVLDTFSPEQRLMPQLSISLTLNNLNHCLVKLAIQCLQDYLGKLRESEKTTY